MKIFTVGHSTRSLEDFIALLQKAGVNCLADVRHYPRSVRQPHFNRENLPCRLAQAGISYVHMQALGGRHPVFPHYTDYTETTIFQNALQKLLGCAQNNVTAVMCAEADWRHCHRRFIADRLLAAHVEVGHITARGIESAYLTAGAMIMPKGGIVYDSLNALPLFGRAL